MSIEDIRADELASHNAIIDAAAQAAIAAGAETKELARQIGYELPGGAVDPDLIQRDIAANMRRSVDACLEVGRGLLVLKQVCGHGNFTARLDVLSIDQGVAQRFMQAARKFSNAATSRHLLPAIGSQSKLLELLVLDDEQIDELAETGQTGELKLDDVACMGVRELRRAVRELREKTATKDRVLSEKNKTIDKLQERIAARAVTEAAPDDEDEMMTDADWGVQNTLVAIENVVAELEAQSIRLLSRIRDLRDVMPSSPSRRAREAAALMRAFAALRTTAAELEIAVSDEGEAEIDPEAGEEAIKREMQAVMRDRARGQADE